MRRQPVDLSAIAHKIVDDLKVSDASRTVHFKLEEGVQAHGDPTLLSAVLQNLLGNAWKFTAHKQDAIIEFGRTTRRGQQVCYVRDNGAGFDMKYVGKLFGAFQRLHAASEFEGNGIGLATVQRIVRRHGGWVEAEGEVARGATFYFHLPLGYDPRGLEREEGVAS
jgi:light-regulated signal transduction histidine kinase (bacteriophytochrome)